METVREPRLVERGTQEEAEHGIGAVLPMYFRPPRVCPLQRKGSADFIIASLEAETFCETRWYRVIFVALELLKGDFFIF